MFLYAPLRLYDLRHSCTVSTLCLSMLLYASIMPSLCPSTLVLCCSMPLYAHDGKQERV
jgi:hypothetical protein